MGRPAWGTMFTIAGGVIIGLIGAGLVARLLS